jgi:hypothetical protein
LTFALTSDHCTGTGGCTNGATAGTITVNDAGGNLAISVTLNPGFHFIDTGFQADIGFNLAGISSIMYTAQTAGWVPLTGATQTTGSLMMDGAGNFQFGTTCTTGCPGGGASNPFPLQTVAFTVDATANLTVASLTQNAAGQFFAVDVIGFNGNTGAVDASTSGGGGDVPEPGPLALLAIGLLALAGSRKWAGRAQG